MGAFRPFVSSRLNVSFSPARMLVQSVNFPDIVDVATNACFMAATVSEAKEGRVRQLHHVEQWRTKLDRGTYEEPCGRLAAPTLSTLLPN
jgi:hypothetical protein